MPRIDPVKLLSCIGVLLSPNGGIRSATEVKRLAGLMSKYSKKLVSKCIYIQILKCTETELLGQFMSVGGWGLVHSWLQDGIDSKNWPLVQELLELLLLCPVDVPRLQSNSAPKLVKGLSREEENDGVRILATRLVEQWLKIARGEISSQNSNVFNKENLLDSQSHIIVKPVHVFSDSSLDNASDINTVDGSSCASQLNEHVLDDDCANDMVEATESEGLVFKITMKDGKQTVAKINDAPPKKSVGRTASESFKDSDSDDRALKKSRSDDVRQKDGKERERSKDVDKHKKSSSSSYKSSSSSKTSSSKHGGSGSNSSSSSSKSPSNHSKSHKSSSSSSSSHKSGSLSSSSRDKDKHKSSSKSSSSGTSLTSSSSKDKKSESSKTQAEKDKDTLAKIQPKSLEKVGKIPKKTNSSSSDSGTKKPPTDQNDLATAAKKKSISIEVRKDVENRPKTVKTYNSQFRSHGLGEEAPPPPSRRDLKKPAATVPTNGIPIVPKRSLSPTNTAKELEKRMKMATSPTIEKPGAIKLIPAKPKPSVLVESDMFMDAISAATTKKEVRKRKRMPSTKESENNNDKAATPKAESKDATKTTVTATPLRFYQDTLEDSEIKEENTKSDEIKKETDALNDGETKEKKMKTEDDAIEDKNGDTPMETAESPDEPAADEIKMPGPGCGPNGPPGVLTLHRRKGPKKSLRWRPQETLEEIRYFELDETERVNVTKQFADMKQMERTSEREAFLISRKPSVDDTMTEQMEWAPLILVDDVPEHAVKSKEKDVQAEREKTCLKTIYFNRAMIPDSALEPDVIAFQNVEPPTIPLIDITGNSDAIHDYTNMPWPEAKGSPPHQTVGNMEDLNGMSNFGAFGQFNSMNWPTPNMLNIRPPPQIGLMMPVPPDPMNPMNMNPMHAFNAPNLAPMMGPLGPPNNMGFMNNFGQAMPPMIGDNRGGNRGQNWFGGGGGGGGNNNAPNNNWPAQGPNNNNNNQRNNWGANRRLCKQFQRGFCRHGKNCKFLHPGENSGPKF